MSSRSSTKIPVSSERSQRSPASGKREAAASRFELIAELGRGGMATVYLARAKKRPEKLLVLKQLRADLAENPEFLAMFLEEARLAGKLSHPNIVETYEVGQDAGNYYIAMEFLDGLSLQTILTKFGWKGAFTFPMQVFVLIEALKALEHAYNQRDDDGNPMHIVHRDVSPPNIIVTFDGHVKLVDFGIAKAANSHVETRTGLIKGKLTYMAPEQAQSGDVDNRTDIYSIGVMLWQAAAGTRRWKGIENTEVLRRLHAGKVCDSPRAQNNGLPEIVDNIVLKAIAADPEARYLSAHGLRTTLESLLREMRAAVSASDLATFMRNEFGEARTRASEVMRGRIAQLDELAPPVESDVKESVTAIRVSVAAAEAPTKAKPPGVRPSTPTARTTLEITKTKTSAVRTPPRVFVIALVGVVVALVLALLAYRFRQTEHATRPQEGAASNASVSMAATEVPPVPPASMTPPPAPAPARGMTATDETKPPLDKADPWSR